MQVCKIVEGQRYSKRLNERQITALLKVTCQRPQEREQDIMQVRMTESSYTKCLEHADQKKKKKDVGSTNFTLIFTLLFGELVILFLYRLFIIMLTMKILMQKSLELKSVKNLLRLKLASFLHHG